MTASTRVTEVNQRTGQPYAKWLEKGPDHFFHAANYNRLATVRGGAGQALLDSYKKPNTGANAENTPDSLLGWQRWIRLQGTKVF